MLRRYLAILSLTGALMGVAATARAQSASGGIAASAPMTSSRGVRLGDALVLHLGLGLELGWDSNVFYEQTNEHNSFYLRLTPSFDLTNRPREGDRVVRFDFHGGLNYVEYLTTDTAIQNHRQFNVDAGLLAAFFAANPYNFAVFDNYIRSTQPPYTVTSQNLDRDTNEIGVRINLSPGGGRLTFALGYLFGIDYFEPVQLKSYDVQYHRIDVRASWRFLPKTAVYVAASESIYHYPTPDATSPHPDSYPFRVDAGLMGLITTKLTLNVWVGYGNGFYQYAAAVANKPNPSDVVAGLALTWKPTLLSTGTLGYNHDFQNSLLGAYYNEDMVYLSWQQLIWRFTGYVRFQYANLRFQGVQAIQATTDGTDNYFTLNVRVDYPFKDWLFLSAGYDLYADKTNRMLTAGTPATPGIIPVDFLRNVVYLRLTASY